MQILRKVSKLIFQINKSNIHTKVMACSRYEYVKSFELDDTILPNVWIVIRVDGKGFHKFSKVHDFEKPNDVNALTVLDPLNDLCRKYIFLVYFAALNLMNTAAITVMEEFRDIVISYGQSDEFSFIFRKEANIFNRRAAKLLSYVTSLFTSSYVFNWSKWFPEKKLLYTPCFDGRVVLYPTDQNLRDYLSWRQADVHINNLYNTAFWSLVLQNGLSNQEAEAELRGTFSADKNELLFTKFGINYNNLPAMFRKGTILLRKRVEVPLGSGKKRKLIVPLYDDMIRDKFWNIHSELLGKYSPGDYAFDESNDKIPIVLLNQFDKTSITDEEISKLI